MIQDVTADLRAFYLWGSAWIRDRMFDATIVACAILAVYAAIVLYRKGRDWEAPLGIGFLACVTMWMELDPKSHDVPLTGWHWFFYNFDQLAPFLLTVYACYAIFTSENKFVLERRLLKGGTVKQCPDCAEVIRTEARVCGHCGYRFAPPP
jgi:hypothetical protein